MSPVSRSNGGNKIGNAGSILPDTYAVPTGYARISVRHVRGTLLVHRRDESNACRGKQVQCIHISRADNAKNVGYTLSDKSFDECFGSRHPGQARNCIAFEIRNIGHNFNLNERVRGGVETF